MYKIFIKDKPVIFKRKSEWRDIPHHIPADDQHNFMHFKETIKKIEQGILEEADYHFYSSNLEEMWKAFQSCYKIIEAGGGLVKNEKGEILFIKRYGKWDLPKGKIEKGETVPEAAMREVEEECNIQGLKIIRQLPTTYHTYHQNDKYILKYSHWFEMYCKSEGLNLKPQEEEGITEVKWMNKRDVTTALKNTYGTIKELIDFYLEK